MLKFIGSGSAFNTELGNNSAYIIKDDVLFLIDCGSTTYSRLMKADLLKGIRRVYVLITHTHPDHVGSLGDLVFHTYYNMGQLMQPCIDIITPDGINITDNLRTVGVHDDLYRKHILASDTDKVTYNNFTIFITPIKTKHKEGLNCYGYYLTYKHENIYYSGDCRQLPDGVVDSLRFGEIDRMFVDTSSEDFPNNPHISLKELCAAIPYDLRRYVHCMHLDSSFDGAYAAKRGFNTVKNEFSL